MARIASEGAWNRVRRPQVTESVRMKDAGVFAVTCRIEGADQVPLDQEDSLVVEVADQLPILFVASEAEAGSSR